MRAYEAPFAVCKAPFNLPPKPLAQHLQRACEAGELRLRFDVPVYHLYCHAFELTLKAFLRAKGVSAHRLASREFGHKLQVLWDACVAEGLQSNPVADAFIAQAIELLDPFAREFEFRYIKVGFKQLPTLTDVQSAVGDLMAAVKPHCIATLTGPIPDRARRSADCRLAGESRYSANRAI